MAMSVAERRKKDRERKAEQRAAAKLAGVPEPAIVYHAVTEAVGFAMVNADKRTWLNGTSWCPVNSAIVIAVAVDILVERCRCNPEAARKSVKEALAPRDVWRYPEYTPSSKPAPGRSLYRFEAPSQVVVRTQLANTPVTPTGRVSHQSAEASGNA